MPLKALKKPDENIKYYAIRKGSDPGCYQLHRPKHCRLKFPVTQKPIHKCEVPKKEKICIQTPGSWRELVVPSAKPNLYPAVIHKSQYERLKKQAKIVTQEDVIAALEEHEEAKRKAAQESDERKQKLKDSLLPQPGAAAAAGCADPELEGPDQAAHTLSRAEMLLAESMPGPKICNQIILATKCHAIRDAQLLEKQLMKKELEEEQRRLDSIMEENRQEAEKRARADEERRHKLRLQNLEALKEQIKAHENAKLMETQRIEEECVRLNQANIMMQLEEAKKLKEKQERRAKLKEVLDQGTAQLLYAKQLQNEEERVNELRNANFMKNKQERIERNKAEAEVIKAAKEKSIEHIANAQKAEQALKAELEKIRTIKIQEDVERDYRRKERDAAIKRNKDIKQLLDDRMKQIKEIHRQIAREIAKDEQNFNDVARQNEEFMRKEKLLEEKHKQQVERHRQAIMKQINDKELARAELRQKMKNEGIAMRMEQEQKEKHEKRVIQQKVAQMKEQGIPSEYVQEVQQCLARHGLK